MARLRFELVLLRWGIKIRQHLSASCTILRQWLASVSVIIEWGLPFGTGIALAQWDEFGAALVCFGISALSLALRTIFWKGLPEKQRVTTGLRAIGLVGTVLFFLACWLVAYTKQGDKPWSPVWDQYLVIASAPPIVSTHAPLPAFGFTKTEQPRRRDGSLRTKDETEVALEFAGVDELILQLADTTSIPAEKPKYWFMMMDATHGFSWPGKPDDYEPL